MGLLVLAFIGGILTILSPCILPVLPFVFARVDQSFRKTGLPLLAGMALTFVAVAAVATGSAGWIVRANQIGRDGALIAMALLGITLLWPGLATRLSRPFVHLGSEIERSLKADFQPGVFQSVLLGVATGLLWAPCAGPILGLVLTGAALAGAGARTAFLLLAYAIGAAVSLAVALLAGGRVFALMKRSLRAEAWIRGVLGVAVLAGVASTAMRRERITEWTPITRATAR
jgi:cytochrome c biogenesis protein CcdA